jgi:hypothetical protein
MKQDGDLDNLIFRHFEAELLELCSANNLMLKGDLSGFK